MFSLQRFLLQERFSLKKDFRQKGLQFKENAYFKESDENTGNTLCL